jgi:hypothetical protein
MKFRPVRLDLARSLVALSVSLAVVLSTHAFAFSSFAQSMQPDSPQSEFRLIAASATTTTAGVVIQWRTNAAADNLGFNIYRLKDGQRTRVNHEIIPGAGFASAGAQALMRAGYSYSWFDRGGTADSTYYIESVSLQGTTKTHEAIRPSKTASGLEQIPETPGPAGANATQSLDSFENYYPAAESEINSPTGTLEDQWAIAAQSGLKIGIKKDGWYRVTKTQMAAAGFNPTVDIQNLRLFVDAQEVAINTSQHSGPFGPSDYIEFYGRGLDTPTTDTRTYYLTGGTTPGRRVRGQNQVNDSPPVPPVPTPTATPVSSSSPPTPQPTPVQPTPVQPTPQPIPVTPTSTGPVLRDPIFYSSVQRDLSVWMDSLKSGNAPRNAVKEGDYPRVVNSPADLARPYNSQPETVQPDVSPPRDAQPVASDSPEEKADTARSAKPAPVAAKAGTANAIALRSPGPSARKVRRRAGSKKRKSIKLRRSVKFERNHVALGVASAPASFEYVAERKDRTVYYSSLLNGDVGNYFGQVVNADPSSPTKSQTITTPNPDLTAAGPAKLEVAMQGANLVYHQVDLKFNGVSLGLVLPPPPQNYFFGQSHIVATFDIPVSLLQNGANRLTFTPPLCQLPMAPCPDTTIVDYTRLTYRHQFRYDYATGNIHLVIQPNEGDTLVVGSKTYTFTTSPTTNLHIGIGVDKQTTATNIANRINLDSAATLCTAVSWPTDVNLTANTGGIVGNSITLIVDGLRLQKTLIADSGAVKFSLRGTQSVKVDAFTLPSVRLLDYTDPLAVSISRPFSEPTASGFAITVPMTDPPSKPPRLLYAIQDGQFEQPASLLLNQASSLNQGVVSPTITSGADFLIVSHKDFIGSFDPLLSQRQGQGMTAAAVDVEDIYDEFSYGVHGPQAIKDFLLYASTSTHWPTKPRYVIFAGDASIDPHNYQGAGNFDLVPTKLVDATYNETASDDWLTDFDGDGIADIPVGRLPVRIGPAQNPTAESDLVVSKIVNFTPVTPQSALLVADDPGTPPFWDFESGTDNVQALLPPSMTVQKSYRRLEIKFLTGTVSTNSSSATVTGTGTLFTTFAEIQVGNTIARDTGEPLGTVSSIASATSLTLTANANSTYTGVYGKQDDLTAHAHIIAGLNQGRAIVNYSGHGNVNVWTGGGIFMAADATALTNGNQLSFVVVMDCLNGYFQDPSLMSLSEAFLKAPGGGAVAAFASSGLTTTPGQRQMELELYTQLYGAQPIAVGDAIKIAKAASGDIDVRTTWILFGDPSIKIR